MSNTMRPVAIAKISGAVLIGLFALFLLGGILLMSSAPEQPKYVRPGDFALLPETEVERLEVLANAGDAEAAGMLFGHYAFGIANKESWPLAEHWHRKAADNGDVDAQNALVLENRWQVFPKDPAKGMKFMEEAAAKGWPGASYELREMRKLPTPQPPKEESPFDERGYRR